MLTYIHVLTNGILNKILMPMMMMILMIMMMMIGEGYVNEDGNVNSDDNGNDDDSGDNNDDDIQMYDNDYDDI